MESAIEKTVCNKAEMDGWLVRKVKWIGRKSAMDRLFAKAGRLVWIEFKDKDKPAEALQAKEHDRFRAAGMEVHVVDSVRQGLAILGIAQ